MFAAYRRGKLRNEDVVNMLHFDRNNKLKRPKNYEEELEEFKDAREEIKEEEKE